MGGRGSEVGLAGLVSILALVLGRVVGVVCNTAFLFCSLDVCKSEGLRKLTLFFLTGFTWMLANFSSAVALLIFTLFFLFFNFTFLESFFSEALILLSDVCQT